MSLGQIGIHRHGAQSLSFCPCERAGFGQRCRQAAQRLGEIGTQDQRGMIGGLGAGGVQPLR